MNHHTKTKIALALTRRTHERERPTEGAPRPGALTGWILSFLFAVTVIPAAFADDQPVISSPANPPAGNPEGAFRIFYIGDSLTAYGVDAPNPKVTRWFHSPGMAASSVSNDYAHRLAALIQPTLGGQKVEVCYPLFPPDFTKTYAQLNAKYGSYGSAGARAETIDISRTIQPNLVVIQLGEHENGADGFKASRASYEKLFALLESWTPKPMIICTGRWSPSTPKPGESTSEYSGSMAVAAECDHMISQVCQEYGVPFVSMADLALDPSCRGSSLGWENNNPDGAKWHPNDKGHQGYANHIFAAYEKARAASPTSK